MLQPGLYEQVINTALDQELAQTDKLSQTAPIDPAEAAKVLAKYVAELVERGLDNVKDSGGDLGSQVGLVNRIVTVITDQLGASGFESLSVAERAEQLLALLDRQNNVLAVNEKAEIVRPETSIARSSLFTGAVHEPQMYTELKKEIVSCFNEAGHSLKINFLSGYKSSGFPPSYAPSVANDINAWIDQSVSAYEDRGVVLYDFVTSRGMQAFFGGAKK